MGALDGVRVIDFGQYIAGPMTGMLLADQGAEVIKVDPPGGPVWETAANATWNRGKRSIVLDLGEAEGVETARRLIASADVVVENFRPGVMDRLELGAEAMTATDPRLVYCSLPGFASDDPRRDVAGWEGVVTAATATYYARGTEEGARTPPVYTAIPMASSYAAFQASVAIAMALIARDRDGVGQEIEVPLFDAMFGALGYRGQHPQTLRFTKGRMRTTQYECADGRWIMFHTGNQNVPQFMELAGITDWVDQGLFDPERWEELEAAEEALFRTKTAQEWEDLVAEAGSECTVCRTTEEWMAHPHARESLAVVDVQDPVLGKTSQPGLTVRMSGTPGAIRPRVALDADREAILGSLDAASEGGAGAAATEEELRAVLDGVKVLDLCIVLAGPTSGRTLAEYGADVIKIDAPTRGDQVIFFTDVSRAKRSVLLDLKSEEGLEVFWQLVDEADVIVQNYRHGAAERLGIDYEAVKARKPEIIYGSMNAFGHIGPWANRPGHEQLAQATTGMQLRFGGDGKPTLQTNAINDYGTGFMGAYGVALALLHRNRTGEGQLIDGSLAYTAVALQSQFLIGHEGKVWDEARGQDSLGDGPMHRAYEASDGWVFVGARREDLERLEIVAGLEGIGTLEGEALASALEAAIASGAVDEWVSKLVAAGAGAHRVVETVRELMLDPWIVEHGLSVTREHMDRGLVTTTGPAARLSRTPLVPGRPAPTPGSDGREILEEIGLGSRFDELVSSGAVRIEGVAAG
ncbi:MAG: CoA transferase [Dehalococcoidia bacterium]|jgi:crotonobetainyl-CoA:carnitine CoA-transferase CaiB-like acyl-CoA transferase|nr:CoA transferase [Dehalococcoidia bacterium]